MPPKAALKHGAGAVLSARDLRAQLHAAYKDTVLPDVLGDFGLSARFLIDGEALIAAAARRAQYTKEARWQTLHLVFYVERWMEELALRRGRFDLIFFQCYDELLWALFPPAVRAARLAVLHHLCSTFEVVWVTSDATAAAVFRDHAAMTPQDGQPTRVFIFERLWRPSAAAAPEQFLEFVDVLAPAFVVTNMSWPKLVGSSAVAGEAGDENEKAMDTEDRVALVWALAIACRMAKLKLLVLDDLEFLEASVHGLVLVPFRSHRFAKQMHRINVAMARAATVPIPLVPLPQPVWSPVASTLFRTLRLSPLLTDAHETDCPRMALSIALASMAAATLLVSGHGTAQQLADVVTAWLLTSMLQSTTDLSHRAYWFKPGKLGNAVPTLELAQRLVNESQVIAIVLLGNTLQDSLINETSRKQHLVPTAADAFDVRLFYFVLTTWLANPDKSAAPWLRPSESELLRSYLAQEDWWPLPLRSTLTSYLNLDRPLSWSKAQADVCSNLLDSGLRKRQDEIARVNFTASQVRPIGNSDLAQLIGPNLLVPSAATLPEQPSVLERDHHWHSVRYLEDELQSRSKHHQEPATAGRSGSVSSQSNNSQGSMGAGTLHQRQQSLSRAQATRTQLSLQPGQKLHQRSQPYGPVSRRLYHVVDDQLPADAADVHRGSTGQCVRRCLEQTPQDLPSAIWYQTHLLGHWTEMLDGGSDSDTDTDTTADPAMVRLCSYLLIRDVLVWLRTLCPEIGTAKHPKVILWKGRSRPLVACLDEWFQEDEIRRQFLRAVRRLAWPELSACVATVVDVDGEILTDEATSTAASTSVAAFQLAHAAPHLRRVHAPAIDSRVQFSPDAWQVKLLDIVDRGESALVVAPTSSGKTFVSFYAIERMLKTDKEGVLVYVAPTKALVNQTVEELRQRMARFVTDPVLDIGVFTRERRESPFTCRVLVTVPQCLDIMLMSPERDTNVWMSRLRYVIFDEVHNIACENGEVWEMLLLLVPCAILALSATIGQADHFYSWLQAVHATQGRSIHIVEWDQRFNDLETHMYVPFIVDLDDDGKLEDEPAKSFCERILPLAAWIASLPDRDASLVQRPIGADVRVLPEDCVALYEQIAAHPQLNSLFADLNPSQFFADHDAISVLNISMADARAYETALKVRLFDIVTMKRPMATVMSAEQASRALCVVLKAITAQSVRALMAMEAYEDQLLDEPLRFIGRHIFSLLTSLKDKRMLPAAVFHMDRKGCEGIAKSLFNSSEKLGLSPFTSKRGPVSAATLNDSDHFDGKFDEDNPLHAILPFGIGVHHAGLPLIYRSVVERLFRTGHLTVVIATSTLAQGLNMPCRSVVFAGSSLYLDSINFRQMSGRAGRRGFDLRGHVVFMGMAPGETRRLLLSGLPTMRPNQPLTPSLSLRIASKLAMLRKLGSSGQSMATHGQSMDAFARLLEYSLERTVQQRALASTEYRSYADSAQIFRLFLHLLHSVRVLRSDGQPSAMSTLISHIHYLEPTNFVLVRILQSRELDNAAATDVSSNRTQKRELNSKLLSILCHLVQVRSIPESFDHQKAAKIALDPLPPSVDNVVSEWNAAVVTHTLAYYVWLPRHLESSENWVPDRLLPFSRTAWPPVQANTSGDQSHHASRLHTWLESSKVSLLSRSSFSGISGASGSEFSSIRDLAMSRKLGLAIPSNRLPIAKLPKPNKASAHVYHFILGELRLANLAQMSSMAVHEIVQDAYDFMMAIKSVVAALERLQAHGSTAHAPDELSDALVSIRLMRDLTYIRDVAEKRIRNYRDQVSA